VSDKLDELQKLPLPRVNFAFDGNREMLTALAPDTTTILDEHWKAALTFFYSNVFLKPMNPQQATERNLAWMRFGNGTMQKLTQTTIKAPNGERTISKSESSATITSLNRIAASIVEKAKTKHLQGN
jgi:hypothetical protein